jgi:hypothetical protein
MPPDEAAKQIQGWLQNGQAPASKTEVTPGYQLA